MNGKPAILTSRCSERPVSANKFRNPITCIGFCASALIGQITTSETDELAPLHVGLRFGEQVL
jgi:hypothetical protein